MTPEQREIVNRYLANDLSYGLALEMLINTGMSYVIASELLDSIDEECDYD